MDNRHRLLRVLVALVWVAGLVGLVGSPIARHLTTSHTDDPYTDWLLALHPSNAWYHPSLYSDLRAALTATLAELPSNARRVQVIAAADTPEQIRDREILRRNLAVWVYPLRARDWCDVRDGNLDSCPIRDNAVVITYGIDLPGLTCSPPQRGLRLCR